MRNFKEDNKTGLKQFNDKFVVIASNLEIKDPLYRKPYRLK